MLEEARVTLHGKAKEYLQLTDVVDSPMLQCTSTRTHIRSVGTVLCRHDPVVLSLQPIVQQRGI